MKYVDKKVDCKMVFKVENRNSEGVLSSDRVLG